MKHSGKAGEKGRIKMKKKVLAGIALLTMVCVSSAFAQQGGQIRQRVIAGKESNGLAQADYIQIAGVVSGGGSPQVISYFGKDFPNHLSLPSGYNVYQWHYEQLLNAKVTKKGTPKEAMYLAKPDMKDAGHCMIRTNPGQTITILTYNDVKWYSPSAKTKLFIIQPNSLISIEKYPKGQGKLVLVGGDVILDLDFRNASKLEEVMSFLATVEDVYGKAIKTHVDSLKIINAKNGAVDKDVTANAVVRAYATGGGVVGAAWSIGGNLLIPAEYFHTMWQWCNQAAMAYALAYVYGNTSNFKDDLYALFAGESAVKESLISIGLGQAISGVKSLTKAVLTSDKFRGSMAKAMPQMSARITAKVTSAAKLEIRGVPVVGKAIDGAIGGVMSAGSANSFGKAAINYYRSDLK